MKNQLNIREKLGDRGMPIVIKGFASLIAAILIYQGVVNIAEAGGFVTPLYSTDNVPGPSDSPFAVGQGVIPKDLLGEIYLFAAGFVLINAKMNLNRLKLNKDVKVLKQQVDDLRKQVEGMNHDRPIVEDVRVDR